MTKTGLEGGDGRVLADTGGGFWGRLVLVMMIGVAGFGRGVTVMLNGTRGG